MGRKYCSRTGFLRQGENGINSDPASEWELKRKGHGIFVQFLKRFDKCGNAFSVIRLVCAENTVKERGLPKEQQ